MLRPGLCGEGLRFWVAHRFQRCDSGTHTDRLQPLRETVKYKAPPGRAIGIIPQLSHQPSFDRITVNVLPKGTVFFDIPDPPIIEARLPDFTAKAQFLRGSEREAAFDQLQGSL